MDCPVCHKPLADHDTFEANVCARALDERIAHLRSKMVEQIAGYESTARVLRRRIVRDGSFT